MQDNIEESIIQKPHIADVLRFYQKALAFVDAVRSIPLVVEPDQKTYKPEAAPAVFERFSSLLGLPQGYLTPLQDALELREIDFSRLPLGEVPAFSLPYGEDDLAMILYLLSRPWFLALRDAVQPHVLFWEKGRCPVCKGQAAVIWKGRTGHPEVACSFCSTPGRLVENSCPFCLSEEQEKQSMLSFKGEEDVLIAVCDVCRSYRKMIESNILTRRSPELVDLMTLPLDIVVQERGYVRRAPNPIGMRKMTATG